MSRRQSPGHELLTVLRKQGGVRAWLAVCLLLFNLVASAALPMRADAADMAGGVIEVCTPQGMVWLDASGHPLTPDPQSSHVVVCQFCLPLMHGSFSPAMAPSVPLPVQPVLTSQPTVAAAISPAATYRPLQARAPPAV